jgi:hypothetical protein
MRICGALFPALLLLTGCRKDNVRTKVLIGETLITAQGEKPIQDAIIVIKGAKIQSVGARKDVPVPQASDRTDLTGEWVVPLEGSRIEPGEVANLMVLKHAPMGIVPGAEADIGAHIRNGEWEVPKTKTESTQTGSSGQSH